MLLSRSLRKMAIFRGRAAPRLVPCDCAGGCAVSAPPLPRGSPPSDPTASRRRQTRGKSDSRRANAADSSSSGRRLTAGFICAMQQFEPPSHARAPFPLLPSPLARCICPRTMSISCCCAARVSWRSEGWRGDSNSTYRQRTHDDDTHRQRRSIARSATDGSLFARIVCCPVRASLFCPCCVWSGSVTATAP